MDTNGEKLTGAEARGYDGYTMADGTSATEVLERPQNNDYYSTRIKELAKQEGNKLAALGGSELQALGVKMPPELTNPEELTWDEVIAKRQEYERLHPTLTDEQLRVRYQDLDKDLEVKYKGSLTTAERRIVNRFDRMLDFISEGSTESVEATTVQLPGEKLESLPIKWKTLKKEVNGEQYWGKYGWSNQDILDVKERLEEVFDWKEDENKSEIKTTLEQLLIVSLKNGASVKDILARLDKAKIKAEDLNPNDAHDQTIARNFGEHAKLAKYLIKSYDEGGLGLRDDYVKHYVLADKIDNEDEFIRSVPNNAEELGWQVMYSMGRGSKFSFAGAFPTLEMRLIKTKDKDGNTSYENSRYFLSKQNFIRWERDKIMTLIGENPETWEDYTQTVTLQKSQSLYNLRLSDLILMESRILVSEDGEQYYKDVGMHMRLEAGIMSSVRELDLNYRQVMHNKERLAEAIEKFYYNNTLVRPAFRKNLFYFMFTKAHDFMGRDSDSKLGGLSLDTLLSYYHLSDLEKLQDLLGKESSFFTKQGMWEALTRIVHETEGWHSGAKVWAFLDATAQENFEKAFDPETGKLKETEEGRAAFVNFINFYAVSSPNTKQEHMVRQALKTALANKYNIYDSEGNIDTVSVDFAELHAYALARPLGGAARHDDGTLGHDGWTHWQFSGKTRYNNASEERGKLGLIGVPNTIWLFPRIGVNAFEGIQTAAKKKIHDKYGNWVDNGTMSLLEVMENMHDNATFIQEYLRREKEKLGDNPTDEQLREYEQLEGRMRREYLQAAEQLEFGPKAMSDFSGLGTTQMHRLWELVISAKQFDIGKFVKFQPYGGRRSPARFDREAFQTEIQKGLFEPARLLYKSYGLNFSQDIRAPMWNREKRKWIFQDAKLAESMFGYEMLNRPRFWQMDKKGKKPEIDPKTGLHVIDYNKVNTEWGRSYLWRLWVQGKLVYDLYTHWAKNSNDERILYTLYQDMFDALENLPGDIIGDDKSGANVKERGSGFHKNDSKYWRFVTGLTPHKIWKKAILGTALKPRSRNRGIVEGLGNFMRAIMPA